MSRRRLRPLLLGAMALLLGGCASSDEQAALDARADHAPAATLQLALQQVQALALEPPEAPALLLAALEPLQQLDPALHVSLDAGLLNLSHGETQLAWPTPHAEAASAWAALLAVAMREARAQSPVLQTMPPSQLVASALHGLTRRLGGGSLYRRTEVADQARDLRRGRGGTGLALERPDGTEALLAGWVEPDSPAGKAGLTLGDRIATIEGQPTAAMALEEAARALEGPVGATRRLTFVHDQEPPREVTLTLALATAQTVSVAGEPALPWITLARFNAGTVPSLKAHLEGFGRDAKVKGVVLDLRGNPGGVLNQAVAVAGLMLDRPRLTASSEGRAPQAAQRFVAGGRDALAGKPLLVAVDAGTAASAELLALALQFTGRATIVGTVTAGQGTAQAVIQLPNEGELVLPWARLMVGEGAASRPLGPFGVVPDYCAGDGPAPAASLAPRAALQPGTEASAGLARIDSARLAPLLISKASARTISAVRALCPAGTVAEGRIQALARRLVGGKE